MGEPDGGRGPLCSSHKSFPFGPNEDLAVRRGTAGSVTCSCSLASVSSALGRGSVERETSRFCTSLALGHLQKEFDWKVGQITPSSAWSVALLASSWCVKLVFCIVFPRSQATLRFTANFQHYLPPAPRVCCSVL